MATLQGLSAAGHLPRLVHRPLPNNCPKATHQGLSTGHLARLVCHRPPSQAYPQATFPRMSIGHFPRLIHKPPPLACPQLSTGHLSRPVHRSPSQACPQVTFPNLSTGYLPKIVHRPLPNNCPLAAYQELFKGCPARLIRHRPPSKACLPQDTFQGLSATGHLPRFVNRPAPREMYKEQHGDYAYWWVMYGCFGWS